MFLYSLLLTHSPAQHMNRLFCVLCFVYVYLKRLLIHEHCNSITFVTATHRSIKYSCTFVNSYGDSSTGDDRSKRSESVTQQVCLTVYGLFLLFGIQFIGWFCVSVSCIAHALTHPTSSSIHCFDFFLRYRFSVICRDLRTHSLSIMFISIIMYYATVVCASRSDDGKSFRFTRDGSPWPNLDEDNSWQQTNTPIHSRSARRWNEKQRKRSWIEIDTHWKSSWWRPWNAASLSSSTMTTAEHSIETCPRKLPIRTSNEMRWRRIYGYA